MKGSYRLSIRQKIMAIAIGLIVTMAVAAVLSALVTVRVADQLTQLKDSYLPAYGSLARTNIRSLERALILRRMVISRINAPGDQAQFASLMKQFEAKGTEVEAEARTARDFIHALVEKEPENLAELVKIESGIDVAMNDSRRYLNEEIAQFLPLLESGDMRGAEESLERIDRHRDDLNEKLESTRSEMRAILSAAADEVSYEARRAMVIAFVLTGLATALGLFFASLVSASMTRPVRRLLDGTRELESGNLQQTLTITSNDEIGDLTSAFNRMTEQLRLKERIRETFGKFVDPRIVASMIADDQRDVPKAERQIVTVFFSDIAGFTSISEQLAPTATLNLLDHYFSAVTKPIQSSLGILDKYTGDGVMAFWTAHFSENGNHAAAACLAALAQQLAVVDLNKDLPNILGLRRGAPRLHVRMGIATGEAVVGTMGSATSKAFTVIGDPVNVASRLEMANRIYGTLILVTEETVRLASDAVVCREIDLLTVAGKTEALRVFEVLGASGSATPGVRELSASFEAGLSAYRKRSWDKAEEAFRHCLTIAPKDGPSLHYLERIASFRQTPPPQDWDGVWHLLEK